MIYAVILAGGRGLRLGGGVPKQLLPLGQKPVIKWSVDTFHQMGIIDSIIIVSEKESLDEIQRLFPVDIYYKVKLFIEGGMERSDSSYNALVSMNFNDDDIVLFHDAARPFVSPGIIMDVISTAEETGAAGTYIPAIDTVAVIEKSIVKEIPERNTVFYAQTPQGFKYCIIRNAYEEFRKKSVIKATDDISIVLDSGIEIRQVPGDISNMKITTKYDYEISQFIANRIKP